MLSFITNLLQPKPRTRPSPLSHPLLTYCTNSICIHIQTDMSFIHTNSTHDSMMICDKEWTSVRQPSKKSTLSYAILHISSTATKASYSSLASITSITYTLCVDRIIYVSIHIQTDMSFIHTSTRHDSVVICDKEQTSVRQPSPSLPYPMLSFIFHHTSTATKASYSSLASITSITYRLHQQHMYPHPDRHVIHSHQQHTWQYDDMW